MRSTKKQPSAQIEMTHPSKWSTPPGVFTIEQLGDRDAAADRRTESSPNRLRRLGGKEEFCDRLRQLTAEVKDQYRLVKSGHVSREFFARYEQHRRIFQQVQFEKYLMPNYGSVKLTLSSYVDAEKAKLDQIIQKQKQDHVLKLLLDLIERGELDYLRECEICEEWYVAARSDQKVCGTSCRQKKFRGNEKYKAQRRETYALKKRLKRIRKKTGEKEQTNA